MLLNVLFGSPCVVLFLSPAFSLNTFSTKGSTPFGGEERKKKKKSSQPTRKRRKKVTILLDFLWGCGCCRQCFLSLACPTSLPQRKVLSPASLACPPLFFLLFLILSLEVCRLWREALEGGEAAAESPYGTLPSGEVWRAVALRHLPWHATGVGVGGEEVPASEAMVDDQRSIEERKRQLWGRPAVVAPDIPLHAWKQTLRCTHSHRVVRGVVLWSCRVVVVCRVSCVVL
jgi:hypothetical protein